MKLSRILILALTYSALTGFTTSCKKNEDSDTNNIVDPITTEPGSPGNVDNSSCSKTTERANPDDFDNVLEGDLGSNTVRLEGPSWNNTLIRDCQISNTDADGIFIRNVSNVVIEDCTLTNIGGQAAIRTSVVGNVDGLIIRRNIISGAAKDGIHTPQRIADGVNTTGLVIDSNQISDTGAIDGDGHYHHIYIQTPDFVIRNNTLSGVRDGNGISIRSRGEVSCNDISGISNSNKTGIRYFSDHDSTLLSEGNLLTISNNHVNGQSIGIDLFKPVDRYDGQSGFDHVVKNFIIEGNTFEDNGRDINVDSTYLTNNIFSVTCSGDGCQ